MRSVDCQAPFTSLYLDPRGFVRVCAVNRDVPLGNVARASLLDIWRGERADALRRAFTEGRWGAGCETCIRAATGAEGDHSFARTFDRFQSDDHGDWPRRIEFALGNTCNLRCIMCTGDLSSSIRRRREGFEPLEQPYSEEFFTDLVQFVPHLQEARFLGGEPFLVPAHHRVWDLLAECTDSPAVHVTTNGTIWTERVEQVLDRFDTSIAVSVDGRTRATVERVRVGARFDTVMDNVGRFLDYTRARGTHFGLTFCLMTENWREFGDFLAYADNLDVDVFVNEVVVPYRLSLRQRNDGELDEILATWEEQRGVDGRGLDRNAEVWRQEVHGLRVHREASRRRFRERQRSVVAEPIRSDESVPAVAADLREVRRWSRGGCASVLELDADAIVHAAEPSGRFLDVDVDPVGLGLDEVVLLMISFYGRQTVKESSGRAGAVEDQTVCYETATAFVEVRSITRALDGGRSRLVAAVRPAQAQQVPEVRIGSPSR